MLPRIVYGRRVVPERSVRRAGDMIYQFESSRDDDPQPTWVSYLTQVLAGSALPR